jgi:ABC-2 type transport system permease protein
MNASVFSRELGNFRTYTLIWTGALLASFVGGTLGSVLTARGAGAAWNIAATLVLGYTNLQYTGPIFSMILGSLIVSQEEDEKTIEFLLSHPLTRAEIVVSKLLAYSVLVLFLNVLLAVAGLVLIAAPGPWSGHAVGAFLGVWLSYFLLTYAFGAAGVFLSMFVVKGGALVGYSIGIPMILALLAFLETVGSDLLRALARLSPYRYLDYAGILETGSVDVPFVCVAAAVSAAFLASSIVLYRKREFAV